MISIELVTRIPHEHDAPNNRLPRMNNKASTNVSKRNITNSPSCQHDVRVLGVFDITAIAFDSLMCV